MKKKSESLSLVDPPSSFVASWDALGEAIYYGSFIIWLCLTRTGNYIIHEFDWLKSILTVVNIFPSRPVMFCGENELNCSCLAI